MDPVSALTAVTVPSTQATRARGTPLLLSRAPATLPVASLLVEREDPSEGAEVTAAAAAAAAAAATSQAKERMKEHFMAGPMKEQRADQSLYDIQRLKTKSVQPQFCPRMDDIKRWVKEKLLRKQREDA